MFSVRLTINVGFRRNLRDDLTKEERRDPRASFNGYASVSKPFFESVSKTLKKRKRVEKA
jgi:hypothetical protein